MTESKLLSDKVVLITGAGRGLGKVMTLALLKVGARVILSSTTASSLEETLIESGVERSRTAMITADLSAPDECERLIQEATGAFGRVDVLINNAGLGSDDIRPDYLGNPFRFWEVDDPAFARVFAINSAAPYRLAALAAPAMIQRGWGRIINNTTSLGTMLRVPVYGGSKAALEAHTAVMANDLAGTGVTANVLVPGGPAVSRMTAGLGIPAENLISADVMAPPAIWLASEASDQVTGRRFIASRWDASLPPDKAAEIAGDTVAWPT